MQPKILTFLILLKPLRNISLTKQPIAQQTIERERKEARQYQCPYDEPAQVRTMPPDIMSAR